MKELSGKNLKTYGTMDQMQARLNAKKTFKLTLAHLQELCRLYGAGVPSSYAKAYDKLEKVST